MFRAALVIAFFVQAFITWRLVGPAHLPAPAAVLAWLFVVALFAAMILQPLSWRRDDGWRDFARRPAVRAVSYGSMAYLSVLFTAILLRDLAWITSAGWDVAAAWLGLPHVGPWSPELQRASSAAVFGASVLLTAWGHLDVRRGPRTVRVRVPIAGLPVPFTGFRIVQLSDIHVGESIQKEEVQALVAEVNALGPDLVAITGDLVDGPTERLARHVEPLSGLDSRHGTYFVAGNHDHYSGIGPWTRYLRSLGLSVLINEHRLISKEGHSLAIAGVDDWSATDDPGRDVQSSLRDAPAEAVRILLAHHPKTALFASREHVHLQLSGHTHGGQFVPWTLAARWVHRFSAGMFRVERMWLYVSRGTFYWGPAVRIFAPAEITVIELHPEPYG